MLLFLLFVFYTDYFLFLTQLNLDLGYIYITDMLMLTYTDIYWIH